MDSLRRYKQELINLGRTPGQKKFIENSFTRWFLAAPLVNERPQSNVVNKNDILFANKSLRTNFNVDEFMAHSKQLFDKLFQNTEVSTYKNIDKKITAAQLQRLRHLYTGDDFENDKNKLLAMYDFIGMNSIHLSIPPIFHGIELFGSPLNTHNSFCSPFEIDKKFGSLGSFFDFQPQQETVYLCNPPFDEIIIHKMSMRLLEFLNGKTRMVIVVTLPIWDSESQKKFKIKDFGLEFKGYSDLKASKFCKETAMLDKDEYPYWDYYMSRPIPASHTHLMILSNFESDPLLEKIKQMWQKWKTSRY